ncbi:unnamed protein product [Sphagnum balticum]
MKGIGCDSAAVINVICHRTNAQRQQMILAFKTMYGKDLIKELISELRGNLEDVIIALMYSPDAYDATQLRKAMEGAGTTESTLIEIMCTRTNAEIHAIKATYRRLFGRDLEHDLQSETSGHFKRLLTSMSVGGRDESMTTNPQRAAADAQGKYAAVLGEKRWGTDESAFNAILCSQNPAQLRLVFTEYHKLTGHDIEQAIRKEFSGDIEDGLMVVVKAMKNRPAFFAERLERSMRGLGTNDSMLIRCVVTRSEVDMVQVKAEYQRLYGKALESAIASETSGKYKDALIALVRGN